MVGRIALRPLLRVLRAARQDKKWAELRVLLKDRLFARRKAPKNHDPLPPLLFQMASGYWLSQAIYVAAKLGIADLLDDHPRSCLELASATCCDSRSLFRVLRALSSVGVVSQVDTDRFALTPFGNTLRSNVPGSLRRILISLGEVHYHACGELIYTVRNDFSEIASIVDVGGGEGQFLRSVLKLYPEATGIVFDSSSGLRSSLAHNHKEDRCSFITGNFFDSVPEKADAYVMCGVLHDWSDELAGVILRNCGKAMAKDGRLLIIETIVPENELGII